MCVCVVWVHPHATMEGTTPAQLLEIYEAGLAATPQEPASEPCAPLHTLLKQAAENDVPLSALELRGAPIGRAGGAKAFAAVLKADTFVTFANLEEAGLGDEGAALVSDALRRHPTIFRLDLGYNGISGRGVKAVAGSAVARAAPRPFSTPLLRPPSLHSRPAAMDGCTTRRPTAKGSSPSPGEAGGCQEETRTIIGRWYVPY